MYQPPELWHYKMQWVCCVECGMRLSDSNFSTYNASHIPTDRTSNSSTYTSPYTRTHTSTYTSSCAHKNMWR
jgi:hypothetical protein